MDQSPSSEALAPSFNQNAFNTNQQITKLMHKSANHKVNAQLNKHQKNTVHTNVTHTHPSPHQRMSQSEISLIMLLANTGR